MFCTNHKDREASGICVYCGNLFCKECLVTIQGKNYCKEHVEQSLNELNSKKLDTNDIKNLNWEKINCYIKKFTSLISISQINYVGLITSIILFTSLFMPYAKTSIFGISVSVPLISTDYGTFLVLFIIVIGILFLLNLIKPAFVLSSINAVLFIALSIIKSKSLDDIYGMASFSSGFYFYLIGSIIMVISPWIKKYIDNKKNEKSNGQTM